MITHLIHQVISVAMQIHDQPAESRRAVKNRKRRDTQADEQQKLPAPRDVVIVPVRVERHPEAAIQEEPSHGREQEDQRELGHTRCRSTGSSEERGDKQSQETGT
nr:hypothetical protein [Starkeya nomas]